MVYITAATSSTFQRSEVDPTGSLWYTDEISGVHATGVLKLTLPGHYGIDVLEVCEAIWCSEVGPTGPLWYTLLQLDAVFINVLKLTLPGHYGIDKIVKIQRDNMF